WHRAWTGPGNLQATTRRPAPGCVYAPPGSDPPALPGQQAWQRAQPWCGPPALAASRRCSRGRAQAQQFTVSGIGEQVDEAVRSFAHVAHALAQTGQQLVLLHHARTVNL